MVVETIAEPVYSGKICPICKKPLKLKTTTYSNTRSFGLAHDHSETIWHCEYCRQFFMN